ncbi:MAG: VPDSG-CTERM sorting domain-containing protein [Candidatus Korobacteraceae bacterium]|jgi:hypothetical protein
MKKFALAMFAIAVAFAFTQVASATSLDFTYTSPTVTLSGVLDSTLISPGVYALTGGSVDVTASSSSGNLPTGTWNAIPDPTGTAIPYSCCGGTFTYDQQGFPGQDPVVDLYGFMFQLSSTPGDYLNIYSNGPGNYGVTSAINGNLGVNVGSEVPTSVSLTVPDGGTTLALLGLVVAGLAGLRRKLSV